MKIRVLSRNPENYYRETKHDINIIHRNNDSNLHKLESSREYTRALNAAKLDRIFAKPFVCNLAGHKDSVHIVERHPQRISWLASASYDGEIRLWDIKKSESVASVKHSNSALNGLSFSPNGIGLVVSGGENKIALYEIADGISVTLSKSTEFLSDGVIQTLDYSRDDSVFVSGGNNICVWNRNRSSPVKMYDIDSEGVLSLKYNKIEENIFGSVCNGRKLTIYDARVCLSAMKITLDAPINNICWNPLEANKLVAASEDANVYLFDVRKLKKPLKYFQDHVNSVLDVDYSPTGREIVTAGYDRTIRIFDVNELKSREVYHTQRMQRVFCVRYTADSQYVFCGSDDMNIRVWKSDSSRPLGYLRSRQKSALNYKKKLLEKYSNHPQIKRIKCHRHLPKNIFNQVQSIKVEKEAQKRKIENRKLFSKTQTKPRKHVVDIDD